MRLAFASSVVMAILAVGCLGRTGLNGEDLESINGPESDAGDSGISILDSAVDSSQPPPPPPDAAVVDARDDRGIDIFDVFPIPDSGPIGACASCVRDKCGSQVNACVNSPECRAGMACVVTKCLTGGGGGGPGGFDFACVAGCFGGDIGKAGMAISAFTCVIGGCGSQCGGLLGGGGIPGFPGGGGGSGGGGGGGMGFEFSPEAHEFSAEELRSIPPSTRIGFSADAFAAWREPIQKSACEQGLASCAE